MLRRGEPAFAVREVVPKRRQEAAARCRAAAIGAALSAMWRRTRPDMQVRQLNSPACRAPGLGVLVQGLGVPVQSRAVLVQRR